MTRLCLPRWPPGLPLGTPATSFGCDRRATMPVARPSRAPQAARPLFFASTTSDLCLFRTSRPCSTPSAPHQLAHRPAGSIRPSGGEERLDLQGGGSAVVDPDHLVEKDRSYVPEPIQSSSCTVPTSPGSICPSATSARRAEVLVSPAPLGEGAHSCAHLDFPHSSGPGRKLRTPLALDACAAPPSLAFSIQDWYTLWCLKASETGARTQ